MQLFSYWRSLATHRVRIALALKGVTIPETTIDLDRGDQNDPAFRRTNPMGAVPALVLDDGTVLTQSIAILEWIEETYPTPPLLPTGANDRARIRALCAMTAADTHPLVVPRVQGYLARVFGADDSARQTWAAHWFQQGLIAYEALLAPMAAQFCAGATPNLADCCLASHIAGSQRFKVELAPYPTIRRLLETYTATPAFAGAHPLRQPGAPT